MHLIPQSASQDGLAENQEGENPQHQTRLGSYLDLPGGLQFDAAFHYVASLPSSAIPSYARVDLRLGWKPAKNLDLSLGLQNLLDARHLEFAPEAFSSRTEVGRSAYGEITWRF